MGGGIGDTPMIVRANGLPVKAVALLGGQSLYQIVVRKDASVSGLKDLKGKKVGVISFQDTGYYTLLGALAAQGLKKEDVSIQAVGNAGVVQLMISGDLQAISAVPEWTAAIQGAGVAVDQYSVTEIFPGMAQAILASDKTIAERPAAVRGVVRATLRAVRDVIADPKKAAQDFVKAVPQQAGKEAQMEDVFRRYAELVYKTDKPESLGLFDPERLAKVQKFYVDNGIIEKALPVSELYTNEFAT
jgi:NitT/TauT family transport system substrate-binding protein